VIFFLVLTAWQAEKFVNNQKVAMRKAAKVLVVNFELLYVQLGHLNFRAKSRV
jgi:hypothetical protein